MARFCEKCGSPLQDGAKFCEKCGASVAPAPEPAPKPAPEPAQSAPEVFRFSALNAPGESALGELGGKAAAAAAGAIPGPGRVIGSGFKSFFSSLGSFFRDPKRMIPTFAVAGVWLILNILQSAGFNPVPTKILSFLTFAQGGMTGGFFGFLGGVLGKGIFAGALTSLIGLFAHRGGEKRSFGETLKGAFGVTPDTLWAYLTGIGAAMLVYLFISGGQTRGAFMGGAAAAFLSARAALNKGFLKRIIGSVTSKGKEKAGPGAGGFARGLTVGFSASALIGLSGVNLILIITGSVLVAGGTVMLILQATGVVKLGKEAKAS